MSAPAEQVVEETSAAWRLAREVVAERVRQMEKWGTQRHHPDGSGPQRSGGLFPEAMRLESRSREILEDYEPTWAAILGEEVGEALTAKTQENLREELVQVAAVALAWIDAIDRRAD